jgi:hypothetical protein
MLVLSNEIPVPVKVCHLVRLQSDLVGRMNLVLKADLLLFTDSLDDPVQLSAVEFDRFVYLHKDGKGHGGLIKPIEDPVRRLLEGFTQLIDQMLERYDQGELRVIEDLVALEEVLVQFIETPAGIADGKSGIPQKQDVSLDRTEGYLECFNEVGRLDLALFHEDFEDLSQSVEPFL